MTFRVFTGGTADWYNSASWTPAGVPGAGDVLASSTGTVVISSSDVLNYGPLAGITLDIAGMGGTVPSFSATGETFAASTTVDVAGGGADLDWAGATTLAGTLDIGAAGTADLVIGSDGTTDDALTLSGLIDVGAGGSLVVDDGALADDGTIEVDQGTLVIGADTALSGDGTILIGDDATVVIDGAAASSLSIVFAGDSGTLDIGGQRSFQASVSGFQKTDTLDFLNTPADVASYDAGTSVVTVRALPVYGPETVVYATFPLTGTLGLNGLFVGPDGSGGSLLTPVALRTWNGGSGDWYNQANWTTGAPFAAGYPQFGDAVAIAGGTVTLSGADVAAHGALDNEIVTLGGTDPGDPAGILADGAAFGANFSISMAGTGTLADGVIDVQGAVTSNGTVFATAHGGALTIDMLGGAGTFENENGGYLGTNSESSLRITGGTLINNGVIDVDGGPVALASGATLSGSGLVELLGQGSTFTVAGAVAAAQNVQFQDTGRDEGMLVIAPGATFDGLIGGFGPGNTIDLQGIAADATSYDAASGILSLIDAGSVVASLAFGGVYGANDFRVASDGAGGSFITSPASQPQTLDVTLPVDLGVVTGGTVSLQSILLGAFGTIPSRFETIELSSRSAADLAIGDFSYWNPSDPLVSSWTVNGMPVVPDSSIAVAASDFCAVDFVAGNDIAGAATFTVPVAFDASGDPTEYVAYQIRNEQPNVQGPQVGTGHVEASEIVNSASLFASFYTGVPNNNDCNNIATAVAAAAGAPLSQAASTTPDENQSNGFWRIVYRGSDPGQVSDWSMLVRSGDIVRMGRYNGGGHSTTILQVADDNGANNLMVFDNEDRTLGGSDGMAPAVPGLGENQDGYDAIGIHYADFGSTTVPDETTVFRLDPEQYNLIVGGSTVGAFIQGSTYANLMVPVGNADIIAAGAQDSLIVDTSAVLDGSSVTDFHQGDTLDLTDLDPIATTLDYASETGVLTLTGAGAPPVRIDLPANLAGSFEITSDGGPLTGSPTDGGAVSGEVPTRAIDGGNLGTLYSTDSQGNLVPIDFGSATGSFVELVPCFARGTRIRTSCGTTAVEQLREGMVVRTAKGEIQRIRWVGHRRIDCTRHRDPTLVWPVRIAAHAFGPGAPGRDLFLSPDHAVFVEDCLIPIKHLINGGSIAQVETASVEYFHVELYRHDILLAEDLPAESYLDTGNRAAFANGGCATQLHPDFAPLSWNDACAGLLQAGSKLSAIKGRLFARAGIAPASPPLGLAFVADGRKLQPAARGDFWLVRAPRGVRSLQLVSPKWIPAAYHPASLDRRTLGVRILEAQFDGRCLDLADAAFFSGFHAVETTNEGACRWTTGDARLVVRPDTREVAFRVADGLAP